MFEYVCLGCNVTIWHTLIKLVFRHTVASNFNFPLCFRVLDRGAGYLKGTHEKPLLVHEDDLPYLLDGTDHWALLG